MLHLLFALACLLCLAALACADRADGTAAEHHAPSDIPADCSTDTTTQLSNWLATVPDGDTAVLSPGGCYQIDGTLELRDRHNLTIHGNGATLWPRVVGAGTRAHLRLIGGTGWGVHDLSILGANPAGPVHNTTYQWQHGIDLRGVQGALIERVEVENAYGDSFYVGKDDRNGAPSRDVQIADSTGGRAGRVAGVAFVSGERITVLRGYYELAGLTVMDIEPNNGNTVRDVVIDGTEIGRWPTRQWQLPIVGPPSGTSATVENITFRNMRFTGSPMTVRSDLAGTALRPKNIRVENNVSSVVYEGPVAPVIAHHTDGLVVTGNTQPVSGGQSGVYACASTGISVSGNIFTGATRELSTSKRC